MSKLYSVTKTNVKVVNMVVHHRTRRPQRIPVVVSTKKVTEVADKANARNTYAYEISKGFRNYLSYPVSIIDRNNIAVTLQPQRSLGQFQNELHIDVTIRHCRDVRLDVNHVLDNVDSNSPKELQLIKESLQNNRIDITYDRGSICFSYRVDDQLLRENDYELYLDQIDYVICKAGRELELIHPHSAQGLKQSQSMPVDRLSYELMINDPTGQFGMRFVNINGSVLPVPVNALSHMKPGVYRYTSVKDDTQAEHFSFDIADAELNLYMSHALAKSYGNPQENAKMELETKTLQHKANMMEKEAELQSIKNKYAEEEAARKVELERLQHELRQTEIELKRIQALESQRLSEMKFDLERRSANRKDSSEVVKWLPAIVGAAAALFGFMIK